MKSNKKKKENLSKQKSNGIKPVVKSMFADENCKHINKTTLLSTMVVCDDCGYREP